MGSEPPNPKRQRLASSPATPTSATSRPGTANSLSRRLTTNQHPIPIESKQRKQLDSVTTKSSTPSDPVSLPASGPLRLNSSQPYHGQQPHESTDEKYQSYENAPVTLVDNAPYPSSYVLGTGQKPTVMNADSTTSTDAPDASPPFSFDLPDHTFLYLNYADEPLPHSSFHNDLPAFATPDTRRPLMASAPPSAHSTEEKQGGSSSEPVPNASVPSGPPLRKRISKAFQACDSCRTLKTKCDENKPCKTCVERGFDCKYYVPALKTVDKEQSQFLDAVVALQTSLSEFRAEVQDLKDRMAGLEQTITVLSQVDTRVQAKFNRWMMDLMSGQLSPQPTPWAYQGHDCSYFAQQGYFSSG